MTQTTTTHTEGPWVICHPDRPHLGTLGDLGILAADGGMVGEVWGEAPSTTGKMIRPTVANARLIAAAPDLLATAEACAEVFNSDRKYYISTARMEEIAEQLRVAIAKATGAA